jgi:hypothetical protein
MLKVTLEPAGLRSIPQERCCFCREATPYWYTPKDVAMCRPCANKAKRSQVPTKVAWCTAERFMRYYGKLAERQCEKCGGDIGIIRSLSEDGYFALGCVTGGHVQQYIGSDADDFPRRSHA